MRNGEVQAQYATLQRDKSKTVKTVTFRRILDISVNFRHFGELLTVLSFSQNWHCEQLGFWTVLSELMIPFGLNTRLLPVLLVQNPYPFLGYTVTRWYFSQNGVILVKTVVIALEGSLISRELTHRDTTVTTGKPLF